MAIFVHNRHPASKWAGIIGDMILGVASNEIIWCYRRWGAKHSAFQRMHDTIYFYGKTANQLYEPLAESTVARDGHKKSVTVIENGRRRAAREMRTELSPGAPMRDWWVIKFMPGTASERTGYPTQKPLALIQRIIESSSNAGETKARSEAG